MYKDKKEYIMELNLPDNDKSMDEQVCKEVLRVLTAMKHPDVSVEQEESKDAIFNRINNKIEGESGLCIQGSRRDTFISYLKVACVVAFFFLSLGGAYLSGHYSREVAVSSVYMETTIPLGVTSKMILADGTAVTLNGGSKLSYPTCFEGKERRVELVGEGFFEVTKDAKRPFIVSSNKLSVKVLGTKFCFRSYQDDANTVVTLKEGSVKATPLGRQKQNGIILEPDQQLVLNNHTGEFQCLNVNTEEYTSWMNGVLYFRNNTLDEIVKILERRFNVDIRIISGEIKNDRYFAHFGNGENVDQILKLLSHKRSWKFESRNGLIEIKTK